MDMELASRANASAKTLMSVLTVLKSLAVDALDMATATTSYNVFAMQVSLELPVKPRHAWDIPKMSAVTEECVLMEHASAIQDFLEKIAPAHVRLPGAETPASSVQAEESVFQICAPAIHLGRAATVTHRLVLINATGEAFAKMEPVSAMSRSAAKNVKSSLLKELECATVR